MKFLNSLDEFPIYHPGEDCYGYGSMIVFNGIDEVIPRDKRFLTVTVEKHISHNSLDVKLHSSSNMKITVVFTFLRKFKHK